MSRRVEGCVEPIPSEVFHMIRIKNFFCVGFIGIVIGLALILGNRLYGAPVPAAQALPEVFEKLPEVLRNQEPLRTDLTVLFETYGNALQGVECRGGNQVFLIMRDGQKLRYDDGRSKDFLEKLDHPDLQDMLSQLYTAGKPGAETPPDFDPGRIRVEAFFNGVYGSTAKQVKDNLVPVKFIGGSVPFNAKNGAAAALAKVAENLTQVLREDPGLKAFLVPLGGSYNRRPIAGTNRLSPHSWGIAIDLNASKGKYWRWGKGLGGMELLRMQLDFPWKIIAAFEAHGFIWGGKWFHYDTMHFEYRPELLAKARLLTQNRIGHLQ